MIITWSQYFMGIAQLSSMRSKDPNTKVGACIVDGKSKRVISVGYNGFPRGCSDDVFPWEKGNEDEYDNKYAYVVHAEANAILNAGGQSLEGAVLYTTLSPCRECTKLIIQAGIKEVVYMNTYKHDERIVSRMMDAAGIIRYKSESDIVIVTTDELSRIVDGDSLPERFKNKLDEFNTTYRNPSKHQLIHLTENKKKEIRNEIVSIVSKHQEAASKEVDDIVRSNLYGDFHPGKFVVDKEEMFHTFFDDVPRETFDELFNDIYQSPVNSLREEATDKLEECINAYNNKDGDEE